MSHSRGFLLLEAVIAMLIIAMVSLTALQCVQMMNASVSRFSATYDAMQARRNAMALMRHLGRTSKLASGMIAYGTLEVRWRSELVETVSYRRLTLAGFAQPVYLGVYRVSVTTTQSNGRTVDQFDTVTVAPARPPP